MTDEPRPEPQPSARTASRLLRGYGPLIGFAVLFLLMSLFVPTRRQEVVTERVAAGSSEVDAAGGANDAAALAQAGTPAVPWETAELIAVPPLFGDADLEGLDFLDTQVRRRSVVILGQLDECADVGFLGPRRHSPKAHGVTHSFTQLTHDYLLGCCRDVPRSEEDQGFASELGSEASRPQAVGVKARTNAGSDGGESKGAGVPTPARSALVQHLVDTKNGVYYRKTECLHPSSTTEPPCQTCLLFSKCPFHLKRWTLTSFSKSQDPRLLTDTGRGST